MVRPTLWMTECILGRISFPLFIALPIVVGMQSNRSMIDDFERDGLVVVKDALSGQELATILDVVNRVTDGRAEYLPAINDIVYEPDTQPPRVRNAFHLHSYNDVFLKAANNPAVIGVMENIRGLIYVYMSDRVRLTDTSRLRSPPDFPVVST